jgi:CRP-like cAMP-binding protein
MADDARLLKLARELFLAAAAPPSIPPWAIERMASFLEEQALEEGQVLFRAGDPPEFIYLMRDGRIRMTLEGGAPLTFQGRWALGGFEVLTDHAYRRTATALGSFRIQRLPADAWLELLEDSFEMARGMLENAARTLTRLEERFGADPTGDAPPTPPPPLPMPDGPLNVVERLALFADIPALRGAGIQTLADLAGLAEEATFERDEVVVAPAETPDRAYVVIDGQLEASRKGPEIVRRFGPGTLVLGSASIAGPPPGWETRARSPARALSFRLEDSADLMEEHFDMVRSVLASLGMERERLLDKMAARSGGLVLE